MKTQIIRHGEVILKPIDNIPSEAILESEAEKYVVAHSETGHHHILEAQKPFKVFAWKGDKYIEVPEIAELWHQKTGPDVHTPHKIAPAIYQVVIKKQFNYFSKIMERVRD